MAGIIPAVILTRARRRRRMIIASGSSVILAVLGPFEESSVALGDDTSDCEGAGVISSSSSRK